MWAILSSLISGVLAPLFTWLNKVQDTKLGEFQVDGTVDVAVVNAQVLLAQTNATLLNNKWGLALQGMFAVPLAVWFGKCVLWDTTLGLGTTPALKGDISTYGMWIIGYLFMHSAISSWGRKT